MLYCILIHWVMVSAMRMLFCTLIRWMMVSGNADAGLHRDPMAFCIFKICPSKNLSRMTV